MDTVEEKATSLLLTAADIIRSNYTVGTYYDKKTGGFCMIGALARAVMPLDSPIHVRFSYIVYDEAGLTALLRLSPVIPNFERCATCANVRRDYPDDVEDEAYYKITHYSDDHCDGGSDAARIFELAAKSTENPVIVTNS